MRDMCQGVDWPIRCHLEQSFTATDLTRQSHIQNKPCASAQ